MPTEKTFDGQCTQLQVLGYPILSIAALIGSFWLRLLWADFIEWFGFLGAFLLRLENGLGQTNSIDHLIVKWHGPDTELSRE